MSERESENVKFLIGTGLALAYGAIKAYFAVKKEIDEGAALEVALSSEEWIAPGRLLYSVVLGPLEEEVIYRGFLREAIGAVPSAIAFGAAHLRSARTLQGAALRFADATAGALIYTKAYEAGGLPLAWAIHSAHNLGCAIGGFAGSQRGVDGIRTLANQALSDVSRQPRSNELVRSRPVRRR